jgi:hypothetical protein
VIEGKPLLPQSDLCRCISVDQAHDEVPLDPPRQLREVPQRNALADKSQLSEVLGLLCGIIDIS